jgi:hypothetical protein
MCVLPPKIVNTPRAHGMQLGPVWTVNAGGPTRISVACIYGTLYTTALPSCRSQGRNHDRHANATTKGLVVGNNPIIFRCSSRIGHVACRLSRMAVGLGVPHPLARILVIKLLICRFNGGLAVGVTFGRRPGDHPPAAAASGRRRLSYLRMFWWRRQSPASRPRRVRTRDGAGSAGMLSLAAGTKTSGDTRVRGRRDRGCWPVPSYGTWQRSESPRCYLCMTQICALARGSRMRGCVSTCLGLRGGVLVGWPVEATRAGMWERREKQERTESVLSSSTEGQHGLDQTHFGSIAAISAAGARRGNS